MGIKRLIKKTMFGGGNIVYGHVVDSVKKMKETGMPFRECLEESLKETITEDMPVAKHIYQMGKQDGHVQGTIEQAKRDEQKFQNLYEEHEKDRNRWKEISREKDKLIDDLCEEVYGKSTN